MREGDGLRLTVNAELGKDVLNMSRDGLGEDVAGRGMNVGGSFAAYSGRERRAESGLRGAPCFA